MHIIIYGIVYGIIFSYNINFGIYLNDIGLINK
jgi:hypothetical protein